MIFLNSLFSLSLGAAFSWGRSPQQLSFDSDQDVPSARLPPPSELSAAWAGWRLQALRETKENVGFLCVDTFFFKFNSYNILNLTRIVWHFFEKDSGTRLLALHTINCMLHDIRVSHLSSSALIATRRSYCSHRRPHSKIPVPIPSCDSDCQVGRINCWDFRSL